MNNSKKASDWYASKSEAPSLPCHACGHVDEVRQVEYRGKLYTTHHGSVYGRSGYPLDNLAISADGSIFDTDGDS